MAPQHLPSIAEAIVQHLTPTSCDWGVEPGSGCGAENMKTSWRGGECSNSGLDVARLGDREPQCRRQRGFKRWEKGRLPEGREERAGGVRLGDRSGIRPREGVANCTKVPCPPDSPPHPARKRRTSTMDAEKMANIVFLKWMSDNHNNGTCHEWQMPTRRDTRYPNKVSSSDGRR